MMRKCTADSPERTDHVEPDGHRNGVTRPLLLGIQPLAGPGTGVDTYSNTTMRALDLAGVTWQRIEAGVPRGRWTRRFRAVLPGPRYVTGGPLGVMARDIFREAQVFFDIHRRPLELVVARPPGIAHFTYPVPLRVRGWRNLYTLHDVIPLRHPALTPIDPVRYGRMLQRLKESAAGFITVSQASRQDICETLGVPESFVADLGQAVSVRTSAAVPLTARQSPGRYLLHCGTIEPRKNIDRLLAAHQRSGVRLPLVLAGPNSWRSEALSATIIGSANVVQLGYTSRETIIGLIVGARALLMPSLAEGFGLPVAEAMALGTPVLTSGAGALGEVSGDAALHVDVMSVDRMAAAIKRLADDSELCERLAQRGRERAKNWDAMHFGERLRTFYDGVSG